MVLPIKIAGPLAAVFAITSHAHFLLNQPPTIGFDDDLEATAPCGSFSIDFSTDNVTNFHVGGDSIALTSIHPQATWLFRATLGNTAVTSNWTTLLPAIVQTGLGSYCEKSVVIPASWAGSKGVLQIVQDAPDGILYQCAAVNFVSGTGTVPSICTNVTGLTAAYTTDSALSNLPTAAATSSGSGSATAGSTTTSTTSSPSSSSSAKSAANTITPSYSGLSSVASIMFGLFAGSMAFLL